MISRDQHFQDLHHPFYGYITFIKSKRIIGFPVKSFLHQSRFDMIKKSNKTLKNFVAILLPGWYLVASKVIYISVFISKYLSIFQYLQTVIYLYENKSLKTLSTCIRMWSSYSSSKIKSLLLLIHSIIVKVW